MKSTVEILLVIALISGCYTPEYINGPSIKRGDVKEVVANSLYDAEFKENIIDDDTELNRVLSLMNEVGWEVNDEYELNPTFKITLNMNNGSSSVYWLGYVSNLGVAPCYRFCSGYWIAASDTHNAIDQSKLKILATSIHMAYVGYLLISDL